MALFYTGKGDKGKSVIGSKKIDKTSILIQTVGALDELNSLIGLARNYITSKEINRRLSEVQENLFIIQANIAYFMYPKFKPPKFSASKTKVLENLIKAIEKKITIQRKFIIPGSNKNSAWLDYLRATVRQVEIVLLKTNNKYSLPADIIKYLNRLSSFFYALARYEAWKKKIKEASPSYI